MGASYYTADNPAYGAAISYHLKDALKTRRQKRKDAEKEAEKAGKPVPYPAPDELRAEVEEEAPSVFLVVNKSNISLASNITTFPDDTSAFLKAWGVS